MNDNGHTDATTIANLRDARMCDGDLSPSGIYPWLWFGLTVDPMTVCRAVAIAGKRDV